MTIHVILYPPTSEVYISYISYPPSYKVIDFHKVEGLKGAYIASQINSNHLLETFITFDKGGVWEHLRPPSHSADGHVSNCEWVGHCDIVFVNLQSCNFISPFLRKHTLINIYDGCTLSICFCYTFSLIMVHMYVCIRESYLPTPHYLLICTLPYTAGLFATLSQSVLTLQVLCGANLHQGDHSRHHHGIWYSYYTHYFYVSLQLSCIFLMCWILYYLCFLCFGRLYWCQPCEHILLPLL